MQKNIALKSRMLEMGISGLELSRKVGITDSRLSHFIGGWDEPGKDLKRAIANVLGCPIKRIFPETDKHRKEVRR